jgi:hypothetical protein
VIVGRIKRELTLSASRHSVTYGEHVRLTVDLELDDHGGSRDVRIVREQGGRRRLVGTITVSDNGVGSLVDEPIRNSTYRWIVLRDATHARSVSNEVSVAVHTVVDGRLTAYLFTRTNAKGVPASSQFKIL